MGGNSKDFGTPESCVFYKNKSIPNPMPGKYNNFLIANNRTQDLLEEKRYTTRYAYGQGQCHCQSDMIFEDFPNTLVWAWSEWKSLKDAQKADGRAHQQEVPIFQHSFVGIPPGADGAAFLQLKPQS